MLAINMASNVNDINMYLILMLFIDLLPHNLQRFLTRIIDGWGSVSCALDIQFDTDTVISVLH